MAGVPRIQYPLLTSTHFDEKNELRRTVKVEILRFKIKPSGLSYDFFTKL